MASKYTHDVMHGIPIRDSDKKRWTKCGAAFTDEQGRVSIKLDYVPTEPGERGLWLSLFAAKPKDGQTDHGRAKADGFAPQQAEQNTNQDPSQGGFDDVPF